MGELFDIRDYDDDERRFLNAMASGLDVSIEQAAHVILGMVAENNKKVREGCVVAEVTDLALIRAKKGPEKVPD